MSVIEQKIEMYEWLTLLKDKDLVGQLHDLMRRFVMETNNYNDIDFESSMSLDQQSAVQRAIHRSDDANNFASNDDAEKIFSQWLEN